MRSGSVTRTARTVARPAASRAMTSGACGGGGPSITRGGTPNLPTGATAVAGASAGTDPAPNTGGAVSAGEGGDSRRFDPVGAGAGHSARRPSPRRPEFTAERVNDLILQNEEFPDRAIDLHRVNHGASLDGDEPGGNAQAIADSLIAAGDQPRRPELAADPERCDIVNDICVGARPGSAGGLRDRAPRSLARPGGPLSGSPQFPHRSTGPPPRG